MYLTYGRAPFSVPGIWKESDGDFFSCCYLPDGPAARDCPVRWRLWIPDRRRLAKIEPEMLCHTLKMAPGSVARGLAAKLAAASETARPLFCMATSMAMAVALS